MNPENNTSHAGEWMRGSGPDSDIVISSRIRFARNLANHRFVTRADRSELAEVQSKVREAIVKAGVCEDMVYYDLETATAVDKLYLVERHLISKEHGEGDEPRGVAVGKDEVVSIMVNEEDHLRIQVLKSGMQLTETWAHINEVDDRIEEHVEFAFSSKFGYLTACPTNVGTGLRVSVMLHLPALEWTKQLEKVFHAVAKLNLAVRGLYGEGTQALGDFYQISNQVTLGKTETEIVQNVSAVIPQIIQYERKVRETLLVENKQTLEDRVWRAFGMLSTARTITSQETMDLLSNIRMGVNLGIIDTLEMSTVNELFILTQPAHLQKLKGRTLPNTERDVERASFIRQRLEEG